MTIQFPRSHAFFASRHPSDFIARFQMNICPVRVSGGIIRIQINGFVEILDGCVLLSQFAVGQPPVVECLYMMRIDFYDFVKSSIASWNAPC